MADDTNGWLRAHRVAAGFTRQKTFASALSDNLNKSITEREVGGWERCEKKYRDNVPYEAMVTVLNDNLSGGRQVTVEQLCRDHTCAIDHCEFIELRAATRIDESLLREAIECCGPELKAPLLKAWQAPPGSVERASQNIAARISAGSASEVILPFSRTFDEAYSEGAAPPQILEQIWAVVEAVSRACVISGMEFEAGRRQEVGTDQAWLMRIQLLVANNLPFNGLASDEDRHLKDQSTRALITRGISSADDPLQRLWHLVSLLVERYDPGRKSPPSPQTDRDAFQRYCGRLNANLSLDNNTKALFFHLMTRSESDEVIDLLYQYLPGLMSFISREIDGPTEGLLIDDEDMLGGWIARWLYRTGHVFTDDISSQDTSHSTLAPEKTDMTTPASNHQSINVTAGDGATVTLVAGQDKSNPTIHQSGIDPAQFLPLLEQLLKATAQEPQPTNLRREIRGLQTEIEEANTVPPDLVNRLTAAMPASLVLGNNTTTILNNISQLWQSTFGGGV